MVDGRVLVATIGATVAAATGVTGLKMGFCKEQNHFHWLYKMTFHYCCRKPLRISHLCHGVRRLRLLSPNCWVRWQRDPCGGVTGCLRPLNTDGGQPRTPERKPYCIKSGHRRSLIKFQRDIAAAKYYTKSSCDFLLYVTVYRL